MTVYKIITDVDEAIPHNIEQVKSKIVLPTYRFVTSVNFALGLVVIAVFIAMVLLQSAFAYSQDEIDRNGIHDIKVTDLKQNTSSVTFDYCHNKYSKESVGALITSDLDAVPVPIDSDSVKYKDCATYGAKVLAESDSVKITLFEQNGIDALVSSFNAKVHDLKNNLAQVNQKISQYKKLDYDDAKIQNLTQKAQLLESQIKSTQSGIKTMIAMKSS
ncbi:MAG: hypothetical protein OEM28_06715 [Nitrosopumilus sp.]|nr:hypothetical protein [Nitrosopumilus sp.]MDH3487178.1 hypothetical protein [Nitrosopumilus sp.]